MKKSVVKFARTITFGGVDYARYLVWKVKASSIVSMVLKSGSEVKLEIGSGAKPGTNGWLTLDVTPNVDIRWDLRRGIPFPDGSVDQIYSSHLFEHLHYNHIRALMKECLRALKKGGVFLVCVPNSRLYIEAYVKKDYSFFKNKSETYKPAFHDTTTPMDFINYVAYMDDEHKYMFDEENMQWILRSIGFNPVSLRPFDPSIDMALRDHESLYVKAVKP